MEQVQISFLPIYFIYSLIITISMLHLLTLQIFHLLLLIILELLHLLNHLLKKTFQDYNQDVMIQKLASNDVVINLNYQEELL